MINVLDVEIDEDWENHRIIAELNKRAVFIREDNLKEYLQEAMLKKYPDAQSLIEGIK